MSNKINKFTLFRVALRSHWIMGTWNFQRMLNIGFVYSIMPALRKLYPSTDKFKDALQRHVKFFNTQPYFASYMLGMVIKHEEQLALSDGTPAGTPTSTQKIENLKTGFMGPLGALGDSFFWETWRPFLGLIAVLLLEFSIRWEKFYWLGPLVFLIIYNSTHEYIRFHGVFEGYRLGERAIEFVRRLNLQKIIDWIQNTGVFIAGTLLGFYAFASMAHGPLQIYILFLHGIYEIFILLLLTCIFLFGLQKKVSSTRLFFGGIVLLWIIDLIIR